MASMYETIMDLPLFKGTGRDDVSAFLEKTDVQFQKYDTARVIASTGDPVQDVKFIIAGRVTLIHESEDGLTEVQETLRRGQIIGAEYLYGLETCYPYKAKVAGSASIMQFSKERYFSLLQTHPVYMINYLNYLSVRAQRPRKALLALNPASVGGRLAVWVATLTTPGSLEVTVKCSREQLGALTGVSVKEVERALHALRDAGLVELGREKIQIVSRRRFLEEAQGKA